MLSMEWIRNAVLYQLYRYSRHGDRERQNDRLTLDEVEQALVNSRTLEQYPDTGRRESCLMAGFSDNGKPIHIVCGKSAVHMVIVPVYIPKPPKFIKPYERGAI